MAIFGAKNSVPKKDADGKDIKKKAGSKPAPVVDAKKENKESGEVKKESMKDLYGAGGVQDKKTKTDGAKLYKKSNNAYHVLVKPLITEKAANFSALNKYIFEVDGNANKIEITHAINEIYGIKPIAVNIVNVMGKRIRTGRFFGQRKNWKKAIVTLPEGKTINIYEGV
jgi:large subunit ribosomal protein L23